MLTLGEALEIVKSACVESIRADTLPNSSSTGARLPLLLPCGVAARERRIAEALQGDRWLPSGPLGIICGYVCPAVVEWHLDPLPCDGGHHRECGCGCGCGCAVGSVPLLRGSHAWRVLILGSHVRGVRMGLVSTGQRPSKLHLFSGVTDDDRTLEVLFDVDRGIVRVRSPGGTAYHPPMRVGGPDGGWRPFVGLAGAEGAVARHRVHVEVLSPEELLEEWARRRAERHRTIMEIASRKVTARLRTELQERDASSCCCVS